MNVSYASTFTQELDSLPSNSIKYVFFIYLVTVLLLQCHCCCCYVKSLEGKGQWMARRVDWRIPGPFELVFMPVSARGFALFTQQNYGISSGKSLNFITNDVFLLLKDDGNYNW